jgi:hypothetical protein
MKKVEQKDTEPLDPHIFAQRQELIAKQRQADDELLFGSSDNIDTLALLGADLTLATLIGGAQN